MPTSHIETVDQERLVLLHCIMSEKKVDVGKLIKAQIVACARKKQGSLIFPCLITSLCLSQGIEPWENEGMDLNKGSIDIACINRLKSSYGKQPEIPPAAAEKEKTSAEKGPDDPESEKPLLAMLQQHLQHQQELYEFMFYKHHWDIQNMRLNKLQVEVPIPQFPKNIIASLNKDAEPPVDDIPAYSSSSPEKSKSSSPSSHESPPAAQKSKQGTKSQGQQKAKTKEKQKEKEDSSGSTSEWMGTPPSKQQKNKSPISPKSKKSAVATEKQKQTATPSPESKKSSSATPSKDLNQQEAGSQLRTFKRKKMDPIMQLANRLIAAAEIAEAGSVPAKEEALKMVAAALQQEQEKEDKEVEETEVKSTSKKRKVKEVEAAEKAEEEGDEEEDVQVLSPPSSSAPAKKKKSTGTRKSSRLKSP